MFVMYMNETVFTPSVTVYPESIPSQQKEHFINVLNV